MLDGWSSESRDATRMASFFADEAIYKPTPALAPIVGREAIQRFTSRILTAFELVRIEILHQSRQDHIVLNERTDILYRRGRTIEVPAMGIFEVTNGLITEWRDYSDMGALLNGMTFSSKTSTADRKSIWRRRRGATAT
jgi:limonene-1,2-epoxide hydrolase